MPTDRRFLVARYRHRVVIREVTAESCSYTMSRDEAWTRAKTLAKGAPRSQNPFTRKQASVATFVGLDMSERALNISEFLPRETPAQTEPTPVTMSDTPLTPVAAPVTPTQDTAKADLLKALTS